VKDSLELFMKNVFKKEKRSIHGILKQGRRKITETEGIIQFWIS
jgi:hypothetical protein